MKKISLAGLCLLAGITASAQTSLVKEVERTIKGDYDYTTVINNLAPAFDNEETKSDAHTYFVAGKAGINNYDKAKIKMQLGQLNDGKEKHTAAKSLKDAYGYYSKALPLDSVVDAKGKVKTKYSKDIIKDMVASYANMRDAGVLLFEEHDYPAAYEAWELYTTTMPANETLRKNKLVTDPDTIVAQILFYQGVAALSAGEQDESIADEYNRKAVEVMKRAAEVKDYDNIDVYRYGIEAARRVNDSIAMLDLAQAGYNKYGSSDISFIGQLINSRLGAKDYAACYSLLNEAIANAPENNMRAQLQDVLGYVYEQEEKFPESEAAYSEAIKLDPQTAKPYFDLGRIIYNQALRIDENADDDTRANTVKPQLLKAAELFEKAYNLNKDDMTQIPGILYRLYYRLGAGYEDQAEKWDNM